MGGVFCEPFVQLIMCKASFQIISKNQIVYFSNPHRNNPINNLDLCALLEKLALFCLCMKTPHTRGRKISEASAPPLPLGRSSTISPSSQVTYIYMFPYATLWEMTTTWLTPLRISPKLLTTTSSNISSFTPPIQCPGGYSLYHPSADKISLKFFPNRYLRIFYP